MQPAPRMISMGSVLPFAIPADFGAPAAPPPELAPGAALAAGMSDALTSTVPPCDSRKATRAQTFFVGEQVRRPRAEAVARRATTGAMEQLIAGAHELFGRHVGAQVQRLRHFRLDLRDLVRDQRIQREHAEDDPDDAEVSRPHAAPPLD